MVMLSGKRRDGPRMSTRKTVRWQLSVEQLTALRRVLRRGGHGIASEMQARWRFASRECQVSGRRESWGVWVCRTRDIAVMT